MDVDGRLIELANGMYVERDVLNIVEKVMAYDPRLKVKYLDPDRVSDIGDYPYKVVELCPDGHERVVFGVWQLDERVLERLYAADTLKHDIIGCLDTQNELVRRRQQQRFQEKVDEANDIIMHYLKSPKTTYSFVDPETGNKIKIDDQEGRRAKVDRQ